MKKFLQNYERIKGTIFYKIKAIPVYETKIERGGCDHLGLKPNREVRVFQGYKYEIKEYKVNENTIKELVTGVFFLDREDAEWALLNMPKKKPKEIDILPYKHFTDFEWLMKQIEEERKNATVGNNDVDDDRT